MFIVIRVVYTALLKLLFKYVYIVSIVYIGYNPN